MRLDGFAEATSSDGELLRIEQPGIAVWEGYCGHGGDGSMAWFMYSHGNISVKSPDDVIVGKMCLIAESLDAKVQGGNESCMGVTVSPTLQQLA
jgi:hypothetical protein